MKKVFFSIALAALTVASCSRDNDDSTPTQNQEQTNPNLKLVKDLDASNASEWKYFSFSKGTAVDVADPDNSSDWDIAVKEYNVRTKNGALKTENKDMSSVKEAPTSGYTADKSRLTFVGRGIAEVVSSPVIYTGFSTAFWNKMEQFNLFKDLTEAKKTELKNNLINDNGWQTFSYPPSFTQNNWVYIVKTADGKAAKIQLTSYNHSTKNTTGFITFKYQVADSNNKF